MHPEEQPPVPTKRNAGKFVLIYFAILFGSALLAVWIFAPGALTLNLFLQSGGSSFLLSLLLSRILGVTKRVNPTDAERAAYIEKSQTDSTRIQHWSRSPILWVGGATLLLFCFIRFVLIG